MSDQTNLGKLHAAKIITMDDQDPSALYRMSTRIEREEMPLARAIVKELSAAITPYLPIAGLAAPQIGINKRIFIFSYDRSPEHFEAVINPTFEPIGSRILESWEGCMSVLLSKDMRQLAKITRYESIKATFVNLEGQIVQKTLVGFAAKVFQHEWDHLDGIVNVLRKGAIVKSFATDEELKVFQMETKKVDSTLYEKPQEISVKEWTKTTNKHDTALLAKH